MSIPEIHRNGWPARVLVPAEDDEASFAAVEDAAALAAAVGAELVLLALLPSSMAMPLYPSALAIAPDDALGDPAEIDRLMAERRTMFAKRLPAGVRARWIHSSKPSGAAIVGAAGDVGADLVVVPMRRGNELTHAVRDGIDRYVLHHSPVPVVVVPAG